MMVLVYQLNTTTAEDTVIGHLESDGGPIVLSDPNNQALRSIISDSVVDGNGPLDPSDPLDFLSRLCLVYNGSYFRVSRPI
jgi:hypothetical protein